MKKNLVPVLSLLWLAGLFMISGCKKSNGGGDDNGGGTPDSGEYYISFKVNGVQKKYTSQAIASFGYTAQNNLYNGVLQGYQKELAVSAEHIALLIFDNNNIAASTYKDPQKAVNKDGDKIARLTINYYDAAGNSYLSMGTLVDENGNLLPGVTGITADAQVILTSVKDSKVEGTFSATLFDASLANKQSITEGKFVLKRIQ